MTLWDHLPTDQRVHHIRQRLTPGRVVRLFCDFTRPPKEKFLLVGALRPYPIVFAINSSISPFVQDRAALLESQVEIHSIAHPFLDHDSFIDCSTVFYPSMEEIENQMLHNIHRLKDRAATECLERVRLTVEQAMTLERQEKRWILEALSAVTP